MTMTTTTDKPNQTKTTTTETKQTISYHIEYQLRYHMNNRGGTNMYVQNLPRVVPKQYQS